METVIVSPNFEVVIPTTIRESLELEPGRKLVAIQLDGHIELVPVRPARELRGFLKELGTAVPRDQDRL